MKTPEILTPAYIAERWPRLFHMAEAGSWPMIREHGLLSTSALLDLFGVVGSNRDVIESPSPATGDRPASRVWNGLDP